MPTVCNSHKSNYWQKMLDWLTWQSLQYGFLLKDRKRLGQLKFNSYSPTVYMFQLSPGEIHHSTSRRENAGDFSEGWTLFWAQATQASWATSSACTNNTTLYSLWRGTPVAGWPVQLVSSVSQSQITPTSLTASLAGQSQTRYQERTVSFSSPHSPAKPVQRHLCRTTWTFLAVTGELYIYCK